MSHKSNSAPPSGSRDTIIPANQADSCQHHWLLSPTEHVSVPGEGLTNIGQTKGVCQKCGATREWEAQTPDNVHGIDSHILASIKEGLGYGGDD